MKKTGSLQVACLNNNAYHNSLVFISLQCAHLFLFPTNSGLVWVSYISADYFCCRLIFLLLLSATVQSQWYVHIKLNLLLTSLSLTSDRAPVAPAGPLALPGPLRGSWPSRPGSSLTSVLRTWWTVLQRTTAVEEATWPMPSSMWMKMEVLTLKRPTHMLDRWATHSAKHTTKLEVAY